MVRIFLAAILFLTTIPSFAQKAETPDSLKAHKVMLIPYDPRYYLSDADRDIAEQSKIEASKFRSNFRHSIDRNIQRAVRGNYECISLLNDTADELEETLDEVMGRTGYRYEKAIPVTPKHLEAINTAFKTKGTSIKEHEDSKTASQYIPVKSDAMYMHAVVGKPQELFQQLYDQYQADIFVFVTQMEIKTNYNSCMDIANKIYRREIMVHFTIYDRFGRLLAGSYATSFFPSNSNDSNKIIGDCFPELARYVAGCLP